jgi:predicted enzyme related to lactoylglutathione lyase
VSRQLTPGYGGLNAHQAHKQGIPLAAFEVADIASEFARLTAKGVAFTQPPVQAGPVTLAMFADTCGNLIQLYQPA